MGVTTKGVVVGMMVAGLAIFMHADANSSAVFHSLGITMLVVSLLCDGAISNMSETIMTDYGVGQDEFIFRMYTIALVAITLAAAAQGDLVAGFSFLMVPGTYAEMDRSGINLNEIDTTDCHNSLESLQSLAHRLYKQDPSKLQQWQQEVRFHQLEFTFV